MMMSEDDVQTRQSDHAEARQFVTIDRRIPVTWLAGGAIAIGCLFAGMYYQLQRTTEKTNETNIEVKAIREDIGKQMRKAMEDDFAARDIQRRVTVIEATLQAQREAADRVRTDPRGR